jgi:nucleotidyltransferase substrate binding protein (TIGR01987 family)
MDADIRWIREYSNYKKALGQLSWFVEKVELSEHEEQGLIQSFEFTFDLACRTLHNILYIDPDYNEYRDPQPVIIKAYGKGYISDIKNWMEMLKDLDQSIYFYGENVSEDILLSIKNEYIELFKDLDIKLQKAHPEN